MFEDRNLKLDLFALALLALTVFLGLALLTYRPEDALGELCFPLGYFHQPDVLVYPQGDVPRNACGRSGALIADLLFSGLGLGAYYLVAALAVLDVLLLARVAIDTPVVRLLGWTVSLVGVATLSAMLVPGLSPGPVIGPGGYLGAVGRGLLELHFSFAGGLILAGSLLLGGLLLCTDYVLLRWCLLVCALPLQGTAGWRKLASGAVSGLRRRGAAAQADEDEEEDQEEGAVGGEAEPPTLSVRILGKPVRHAPPNRRDDVDDELEDQEEDEDEENELGEGEAYDEDEDEDDRDDDAEADEDEEQGGRSARPAAPRLRVTAPRSPGRLRVRRPSEENEREEVISQLEEASRQQEAAEYELPSLELLSQSDDVCYDQQEKEVRQKAKILERTFADFGFQVKVVEIETGPVIAQYEVELEAGLRLSKITGLADDLAIALRVPSVRIVAPIPGKNTVGIEVPNQTRQIVRLREVMEETNGRIRKMGIPLFLGKDVSGNPLTVDLSTLPHLLIAGRTGTGKSVCLNAIIASILMTRRPDEVRMLMIDPKMVELSGYKTLPHLMHPVVTDMRKAEAILAWAVEKMEERYQLLAQAGVRHVSVYNQLGEEELMERLQPEDDEQRQTIPLHLPYIVIVADEMADLMMTAGKEVEQHIIRLAQKSRAVGIHLILATQKPTVDVITGLIKSNLPARIAFQVASRTDSRVVLDEMGADKLLGNGDMLFLWPGTSTLLRGQGTYLSDDEINSVVEFVSTGEQHFVRELVQLKVEEPVDGQPGPLKRRDELYEAAVDIVVREGRGSVSLLQRALGIGYGRSARLIDFMAEDGIVGTYAGSQAREVLITLADWEQMQRGEAASAAPPPAPAPSRRPNRIRPEANGDRPRPDDERAGPDDDRDDDTSDDDDLAAEDEDDFAGQPRDEDDDEDDADEDDDGEGDAYGDADNQVDYHQDEIEERAYGSRTRDASCDEYDDPNFAEEPYAEDDHDALQSGRGGLGGYAAESA